MLLALTGFVMIGLLMYFLLKGKAIPVTLFVVLPIIGALINGFGIADITDYIKSGVSTNWGMAALFVFVITECRTEQYAEGDDIAKCRTKQHTESNSVSK